VLRVMAWLLLVIALARPQWGSAREVLRGQGVAIVLALDISNSMAALDFEPNNRLAAAKQVISDFIAGREFDRIGLVVFARSAYHQSPLTLDYDVLLQLLDAVRLVDDIRGPDGSLLLVDGTAIGLGIASSVNMLRSSQSASKVIILLTDGDNNAGLDPLEASSAAAAFGIRVYTIGVGRPGLVSVPDPNNPDEIVQVESDLNESALQEIAAISDGLYFRAEDQEALGRIYERIDTLERSDIELEAVVQWQDRASIFVVCALCLLLIEIILRRTVFQVVP
jgi:Ca-activated chloride channel family protein